MESKKEIDFLLPEKYKPTTLFFYTATPSSKVIEAIKSNHLTYPLIIKPDIGMQGKGVIKVPSERELIYTINQFTVDYIIQPFIPYDNEIGIFYVRFPHQLKGKITGIVEKGFLSVIGNGINTIEELLYDNPRHILQIPSIRKIIGNELNTVLNKKEEKVLVPYGSHARGSLFKDGEDKITPQLENLIDRVCSNIDGFYYGRLDIRFSSYAELSEDKNWCIIELNGAGSEPTHMYDPVHSIFYAWKEIIRHWKMLYSISVENKKNGAKFLTYKEGLQMFSENSRYLTLLNKIHFDTPIKEKTDQANYYKCSSIIC
ncbi:MAG: ATP-grasp domain-containing protein [Sediminibacterium sp.]|nr:ATP-grasp domain-containing protein [Sediminibacterium sp.]